MKRITPLQKKIADAHIAAMATNKYDDPALDGSLEQLKATLLNGKTVRYIAEVIKDRRVSITSQLIASGGLFGHQTKAFKKGMYDGFKEFLTNLNIN